MKRKPALAVCFAAVFALAVMVTGLNAQKHKDEVLEYKVQSIDPGTWVVTALETASGNVVKFRLPPTVFKGKSFDANLERVRKGQRLSIRAPRNVKLRQLKMDKPVKGVKGTPRGVRMRTGRVARARAQALQGSEGTSLPWKILNVNPREWIVTAKNSRTGKIAKFKAHAEAFRGFVFKANLRDIKKGEGFEMVAPNNTPLKDICTLLEKE